jgi:Lhr-like helicase
LQRIALSATIQPLGVVAEFVGGLKMSNESGTPRYTPRPVAMLKGTFVQSVLDIIQDEG